MPMRYGSRHVAISRARRTPRPDRRRPRRGGAVRDNRHVAGARPWGRDVPGDRGCEAGGGRGSPGDDRLAVPARRRSRLAAPHRDAPAGRRTGVALGTVVGIGSGPAMAGLIHLACGRRGLTRGWLVGTTATVLGAGLLASGGTRESSVDPVGLLPPPR